MYAIKTITSQDTFAVRQPVLRPGKTIETCIFDGDDLPTTIHFGIYDADTLVGIVSIFTAIHELFEQQNQYQIRGMAVLRQYQGKGLGELLVRHAEAYVVQNGGALLWCNAREKAIGFYEKVGYYIIGNPFYIKDIGTHYVMFKIIQSC
ncbi:GNAT family N-acetyltransferase [Flavobacterium sp. RHBU_24]|uniref:GNAT family N-acetyltransferase n=1 Tax=Flavobacterium sp. RHBU_24 TaxID=3391185 RepID=UPI00398563BF